jgi:hypothetical protein
VEATLPHATLRYALADALLDKDGDMGGALPLALPFDGVHTQAYAKGDHATGAPNLTFLAEVDLHRYCVTKDAWSGARKEHDTSFLAKSAVETSRIEGDPRVPVPLGMIDLEPSVGWPLVLSLPFFLGDEQWDATNSPAKDFDIVTVSPEQAKTAHRLYHNTCYFHEPITGRFMRMEQRAQWNVQMKRSPLFPKLFLSNVYFPVFWGEKLFVIDPIDAERFQDDVLVTKGLAVLCKGLGIGFGVVVFLFGVAYGLKANGDMKRRDAEELAAMNFAQPKKDQFANQRPVARTLEI